MQTKLPKLLDKPFLLPILAALVFVLAANLYQTEAKLNAPQVPGWSWKGHPNTLLICYRDCGCSNDLSTVVMQGILRHMDVVVVAQLKQDDAVHLANSFPNGHIKFLWQTDQQTLQRLSPLKKTTVYRIHSGHIIRQATGVLPTTFF